MFFAMLVVQITTGAGENARRRQARRQARKSR